MCPAITLLAAIACRRPDGCLEPAGSFFGLLAGPVLASAARSDLSARLYAPLLPMLFGLAFHGAEVLWTSRPNRWSRWWKSAGVAVTICFVWQPLSGAVSQWQFWQARFPVELEVKLKYIIGVAMSYGA